METLSLSETDACKAGCDSNGVERVHADVDVDVDVLELSRRCCNSASERCMPVVRRRCQIVDRVCDARSISQSLS